MSPDRREAARWGWILSSFEIAYNLATRDRNYWTGDVPPEIRAAASKVSEGLEELCRYARQRAGI